MHGCICADSFVPEWWSLPTHTSTPPGGQWVLTGFSTSDQALAITRLLPHKRNEILRLALQQLDDMFGSRQPNASKDERFPATSAFVDWATKDWGGDKWIKTGYRCVLGRLRCLHSFARC
jgi:hypothetical protein